jgi:hypothetical protein
MRWERRPRDCTDLNVSLPANRLKTKLYHPKLLRYLSRTLSSLLPAIAERGERGATRAPAVEVAVPLRLR